LHLNFFKGGGDLEKGSKETSGKAFDKSEIPKEETDEKWVKNYVPYGDYPNGAEAKKQVESFPKFLLLLLGTARCRSRGLVRPLTWAPNQQFGGTVLFVFPKTF
jgi:hypothetical protein